MGWQLISPVKSSNIHAGRGEKMAIVVGDIHGNVEKVRTFLGYRPDQEHVCLGDILDSFTEPQERQLEAFRLLVKSDAILLWGNHDLHYLKRAPWICTGIQYWGKWRDKYTNLVRRHKSRFKAAHAVDGWLCTHAGCNETLQRGAIDAADIADYLNAEFAKWVKKPQGFMRLSGQVTTTPDSIFHVGDGRGGRNGAGGIFWFDFQREPGLAPVKQLFGHTECNVPVQTENYVALDTTNNKEFCWLYDTETGELVRLDLQAKPVDNTPKRFEDLPPDDREPFKEWLTANLSSCPIVEGEMGYWPTDYRCWKRQYPRLRDLPLEERGPFQAWLAGQTLTWIKSASAEDQDFFHPYYYKQWKAGGEPLD